MSVKEMDTIQALPCENNLRQVLKSNKCERSNFKNDSHSVRMLENLQSLLKYVNNDFTFIQNKYR